MKQAIIAASSAVITFGCASAPDARVNYDAESKQQVATLYDRDQPASRAIPIEQPSRELKQEVMLSDKEKAALLEEGLKPTSYYEEKYTWSALLARIQYVDEEFEQHIKNCNVVLRHFPDNENVKTNKKFFQWRLGHIKWQIDYQVKMNQVETPDERRRRIARQVYDKDWQGWYEFYRRSGYTDEEAEYKTNEVMGSRPW